VTDENLGVALHPPDLGPSASAPEAKLPEYSEMFRHGDQWYEAMPSNNTLVRVMRALGLHGTTDTLLHPSVLGGAITVASSIELSLGETEVATGIGEIRDVKPVDEPPLPQPTQITAARGPVGATVGSRTYVQQKREWPINVKAHPDPPGGQWYWQRNAYGYPLALRSTIDGHVASKEERAAAERDAQPPRRRNDGGS